MLQDIRYGLRMLVRTPAVTSLAVLALALGIGANTAIFSVVYAVLFRPLPVRDPARMTTIVFVNPRLTIPRAGIPFREYVNWRERARAFESMAAAAAGEAGLVTGADKEPVRFWRVSANFFPSLGVNPVLGRTFLPEEDRPGAGAVALLGYDLWQRRFGGDRRIAGQRLTLDNRAYTIVGVLPPRFHLDGNPADVFAPLAAERTARAPGVHIYARLKPGLDVRQAEAELATFYRNEAFHTRWHWEARVYGMRDLLVREVRLSLLVLLGAVGLVVLIACANIASMLLARSAARTREMAIRTALGAGRKRLIRQLLTESTLLGVAGGACGLLLAGWLVRLVPLIRNDRLPALLSQTRIDGAVLAFTLTVSVATGLLFGAVPALSVSQSNVRESLQEGGRAGESRRHRRLWNLLVISETALAMLLLTGATLMVRSFYYLRDVAPGFMLEGLLTAAVNPPPARYTKPEQFYAFYGKVLATLRATPGVQSATLASGLPLGGEYPFFDTQVEGHERPNPDELIFLLRRNADTDYFRTLRIPLRRGRVFTAQDRAGATRVIVINEAMAQRFWPGQNPIGKHLGAPGGAEYAEIVGVVRNVRAMDATHEEIPLEVIFHALQAPPRAATLAVRADPAIYRDPMRLAPVVRRAVAEADKDVPVSRVVTMRQIASARLVQKRLTTSLVAAFAGLALLLAALGIYGVLSFTVSQRTHEIGVRLALGAPPHAVTRMVVERATLLALSGILVGIVAALGLTRLVASILAGVSRTDPLVYGGVSAALLATAALAAWLPARRAARVDPAVALRHE